MIHRLALVVLAMATVVTPARAQSLGVPDPLRSEHEKNWANCLNSNPDLIVKGCTAIIETHADTPADLATAFNNRGNAFDAKGELDRAIEDYNQAIQLRPDYAAAFNNRGNAHTGKHEYDRAILDFSEAIRIKPGYAIGNNDPTPFNYASAFDNRGIAYIYAGEYNFAILDFNEAIRIKPDDADAFYNRGIAYSNGGDYDGALGDFNKSLQLNPKNAYALYARGVTKQNMHDAAGAETDRTTARQIDPEVAGKMVNLKGPPTAFAAPVAPAQSKSPSAPSCGVLPDSLPGIATATLSNHAAPAPTYVDDSVEELKRAVPALRGIKFEAGLNAQDSMTVVPAQDGTESILEQTSAVTADLLHRIPNLIAREEVQQTTGSTMQNSATMPVGRRMQYGIQSVPVTQYQTRIFGYRIVSRKDPALGDSFDEYRTDAHDHPIRDSADDPDTPRSTGFATSWLFFIPGNIQESRFRYLGRQKIGNHETYVLAFAQTPGHTHMDTVVHTPSGPCLTYSQGVAWIDQSTFQIVRMQTDLLAPLPSIQLIQLRSILNYSDVKIPKLNLMLWLPSDVETTWLSGDRVGDELHRYSNYRLFASTVTILPADESPSQ
jgi:lipoprotein NlpI